MKLDIKKIILEKRILSPFTENAFYIGIIHLLNDPWYVVFDTQKRLLRVSYGAKLSMKDFKDFLLSEFPFLELYVADTKDLDKIEAIIESLLYKKNSPEVPLKIYLVGTSFQIQAWEALIMVPRSTTMSYQKLSQKAGLSKIACRAVANALGKNRLGIIVPCHRIIAKDGSIGGFGWGLPLKKKLLAAEDVIF